MKTIATSLLAAGAALFATGDTAQAQYGYYGSGYGYGANHGRYHDDLSHREFHRDLYHRDAHRYPMTWGQHGRLHDQLDHGRFHDQLEHRDFHRQYRPTYIYPSHRPYGGSGFYFQFRR